MNYPARFAAVFDELELVDRETGETSSLESRWSTIDPRTQGELLAVAIQHFGRIGATRAWILRQPARRLSCPGRVRAGSTGRSSRRSRARTGSRSDDPEPEPDLAAGAPRGAP